MMFLHRFSLNLAISQTPGNDLDSLSIEQTFEQKSLMALEKLPSKQSNLIYFSMQL